MPTVPGGHFDRYLPASGQSARIRRPAAKLEPDGTRKSTDELFVRIGFIPTKPVVEMNDSYSLYSKGISQVDQY
jgi:hypothetical protein